MKMLISNIQRFCLNDGTGIRTTVFFMGCPLKCFWCSNPENLESRLRKYSKDNVVKTFGRFYEEDELFEEIIKDKDFFENGGGVTFSGGECLLFLKDNISLLKRLKKAGVSICVETCLNVPKENILSVKDYIDEMFVDLKIFTDRAKEINCDKDLVLNNLQLIKDKKAVTTFRIPLVKHFNDDLNNLDIIKQIIFNFNPKKVEIFEVMNLGKEKYISLGLNPPKLEKFDKNEIEKIKQYLEFKNIVINKL